MVVRPDINARPNRALQRTPAAVCGIIMSVAAGSAELGREVAEAKMGVDVRDIPAEAGSALPDRLREAGFDVEISSSAHPWYPEIVVTRVICRRGGDVQHLGWGPSSGKSGECRVGIANSWSWRRSVRERHDRLQAEVTAIIERNGGYWPFPG